MKQLQLRKLNAREAVLAGLVAVSLVFMATRVLVGKWRTQLADINRELSEASLRNEKDRIEYEDLFKKSLTSSDIARSGEIIAKIEGTNDYFSKFVTQLAHQDGVGSFRILRMSTEAPVQTPDYVRTPILLTVESSFPAVGQFLENLENSPSLAEIDSMEIYRIDDDLKKCSAKIKLSNYVVKR